MQIAVLSDLHLGRKNALDRFARAQAHVEARFVSLLRDLERHVDKIVLLGDVFETLKGARPGGAERELRAALASYPQIAQRVLDDRRYQLVIGNHDAVASRVLGAPEFHTIEDRGTRLLFFHGHQLDPLTQGRALISRAGVFIGGWLERLGFHMTPGDAAPRTDGHLGAEAKLWFERAAVALGARRGADVVVTGHTHQAVRREHGNAVYLNSGTCVAGRRELLLLDTTAQRYDVILEPELAH